MRAVFNPLAAGATILAWIVTLLFAGTVQARSLPDFSPLVEKLSPAVVNISTSHKAPAGGPRFPGLDGPEGEDPGVDDFSEFLRRFWGHRFQIPEQERQSMGSGFLVSQDGYVLTNYHVVKDADEIIVRLSDRRELVARLVGGDTRSDIALLKLEGKNFPFAKTGNSEQLRVGAWVLAIGSPFGFDHSVTAGIVSAKGRSLPNENYVPFIQTDVAINPGNSGGPLFDLDGRVVGINSQIYTRGGGSIGLSFAIPVEVALEVVQQLKERGSVERGWLGVQIQEVNRDLAESFGLHKPMGALVAQVFDNTPAAAAGLREGDVILDFDGHEIQWSADLPHVVGRTRPGKTVPVQVMRERKKITLPVEVGLLPEDGNDKPSAPVKKKEKPLPLGLGVEDLPEELAGRWELDGGVLVTQVREGPAAAAGVQRGDVLTMIDGHAIRDSAHFAKLVAGLEKGRALPIRVVRRGRPFFSSLRVEDG